MAACGSGGGGDRLICLLVAAVLNVVETVMVA